MKHAVAITLVAAAFAMRAFSADAETLAGRAAIIDGDSLTIDGERVHILDVDAPETAQFCFKKQEELDQGAWHCGEQAAAALSGWIGAQDVTCDTLGRGIHNGLLARCAVAGKDLALWLAANGWAVPAHDCKCEVVRSAADRARSEQVGIWSSAFTMPWDWRKTH